MTRRRASRKPSRRPAGETSTPATAPEIAPASCDRMAPETSRTTALIVLAAITLLGAVLRFSRLEAVAFWNDEALQLNGIELPLGRLREQHLKTTEFMPPLSYVIQRAFWLPLQTKFAARLPGAVFGVLMIPLAYLTVRRFATRLAGLAAAFLTATSFFLVWYSQECRTYIFWGFALWLCLYVWLDCCICHLRGRVPGWKFLALFLSGSLCGAFHFGTLLFLPLLGATATVFLLRDHLVRPAEQRNLRAVGRTFAGLCVALLLAELASYAIMRWSVNWALFQAHGQAEGGYRPAPREAASVLLKYTWGNGWRLLPVAVLLGAAFAARDRRQKQTVFAIAVLLGLTVLVTFYVRPTFSSRNKFLAAPRYLFWNAWAVITLMGLGWNALLTRLPRRRGRAAFVVLSLAIFSVVHVPLFRLYYRMDAKTGNYSGLKRAAENLSGHRLMVLANGYDMQYIRHYWPANCTHAAAPIYDGPDVFDALNIRQWLVDTSRIYPDIALQLNRLNNYSGSPIPELDEVFAQDVLIRNGTELVLRDLGVNPNEVNLPHPRYGMPMNLLFNTPENLLLKAAETRRDLLLFDGRMPLVTTVNPNGTYERWRVLHRPVELTVVGAPGPDRRIAFELPVARLSQPARIVLAENQTPLAVHEGEVSPIRIFDPGSRQWLSLDAGTDQIARIGPRTRMQVERGSFSISLPIAAGENRFLLVPEQSASLIGPPPPHLTLQRL